MCPVSQATRRSPDTLVCKLVLTGSDKDVHELGIAESVLDAVRAEVRKRPGVLPTKVGLRIGEMSAIDEDALRFAFDALVRDSDLHSLQLEIERCPLRYECLDCRHGFVVENYDATCPECGQTRVKSVGGDELDLAYLEIEDDVSSAIGKESTE